MVVSLAAALSIRLLLLMKVVHVACLSAAVSACFGSHGPFPGAYARAPSRCPSTRMSTKRTSESMCLPVVRI